MNSNSKRVQRPCTWGAMALLVAACGGGDRHDLTATPAEREALASATLLDDDGAVMPPLPSALPVDGSARTRAGRYATETQARDLRRALGAGAVRELIAPSEGDDATAQAQEQVALQPPRPAAVLVRGDDHRLAAVFADRLDALGIAPVWLVTP
jgi:hypothetical protein